MRWKKLLIAGAVVLLGLSATGAAMARGRGAHAMIRPATPVSRTFDADNVQAGDQISPDTGVAATGAGDSTSASEGEKAGESEGETSGEGENASETDGPGGHEDPPGQDVNHEFQGEE